MIRAGIVASAVALAACTEVGSSGETYKHLLSVVCSAPPNVMGTILTTQELERSWEFICGHVQSVPPTRVTITVAEQ